MFQPVSTSGSQALTRSQNAVSAANSLSQRTACLRHLAIAAFDDQDFVNVRAIDRDGEQPFLGVRLDVKGQHARIDPDVRWPQRRIVEDPGDALACARFALDRAASLDAALDEIAHGEAHVRFERINARRMQPIAHWRHVSRDVDLESAHGDAIERSLGRR